MMEQKAAFPPVMRSKMKAKVKMTSSSSEEDDVDVHPPPSKGKAAPMKKKVGPSPEKKALELPRKEKDAIPAIHSTNVANLSKATRAVPASKSKVATKKKVAMPQDELFKQARPPQSLMAQVQQDYDEAEVDFFAEGETAHEEIAMDFESMEQLEEEKAAPGGGKGLSRFQVLRNERLGSGGFGTVYKGFDPIEGIHVAVKETPIVGGGAALEALEDEYQRLVTLDHPNIVKVLGSSVDTAAGVAQLFMEWMSSGSVKSIIDQTGFRLHENVIRRYTLAALEGLAYLHSKNILHRDVKPANMLVEQNGSIKLSDFGTSKATQNQTATTTQHVVGTCAYMAPESIAKGKYSPASDLWALGCSVVEMATGRPPWDELPTDQKAPIPMMFYIGTVQPPNHHPRIPGHLSAALQSVVEACFAHDAKDRQSAAALMALPYFTAAKLPGDAETLKGYQTSSRERLEHQMSSEGGLSSGGGTSGGVSQMLDSVYADTSSNTVDMMSWNTASTTKE